jgi:aspartyl-tRNA(Asn)/glutamyl-tRNA(Gln) amidotransferase subunit A
MPAADSTAMTVAEMIAAFRARTLSPVEALEASLKRLDEVQPRLNPFCWIDKETGRRMAKESEARWAKGAPKGPLDGVPIPIKDTNAVIGWPFRVGSLTMPATPVDYDGPMTARLRAAGAVFFGKTTTPEFGWKGMTDSPLSGITRNPWNRDKGAGGSSGGAAVSIATGIGPIATGGDGGGSIRMPGAFSGVFGIKPSYGRVSTPAAAGIGDMSVHGPMGRTVACTAAMLRVIAEPDPRDPFAIPWQDIDYVAEAKKGVKGLKIAFSPDLGYVKVVDPRIAAAIAEAVKALADAGAIVEAADPGFPDPAWAIDIIWRAANGRRIAKLTAEQMKLVEPALLDCAVSGLSIPAVDFIAAQDVRLDMARTMTAFHGKYDLLVTPTMPITAFEAGLVTPDKARFPTWLHWSPFTWPFNMTRQPAATCPAGFVDGLPIGLHIVGPMFREDLVLRASAAFEAARPFRMAR